ncbi:MAG: hypothetical protein GX801_03290 [Fibrobacter sp.]|nr:hypothetical protein [Fibrobacter sp.]
MSQSSNKSALAVVLVVVLALPVFLSIPVWKQNTYLELMRNQAKLKGELALLKDSLSVLDKQITELQSLQRMEALAPKFGLSFNKNPIKVMEIPTTGARP